MVWFQFSECRYPVSPATFVEEAPFSPSYVLGTFVKNHTGIAVIGLHVFFCQYHAVFIVIVPSLLCIPSEFMNSDNFHSWSITSYTHLSVGRRREADKGREVNVESSPKASANLRRSSGIT
jgi:hypothetical protein